MTVYELKDRYKTRHSDGHFFDSDTLKFFGERYSEMRVLKNLSCVTDYCGQNHICYVLSSLQRNYPSGPRRIYHYFDTETYDVVQRAE